MLRSVLLFISIFGTAAASGCGLADDIDPADRCETDGNGYSVLDMGLYTLAGETPPITINIATKTQHTDAFSVVHPGTDCPDDGTPCINYEANNGRFVLSKKQAQPNADGIPMKTIKITVTRPKGYSDFGGEWVQMYPKDSWENITNEYEPFTFNDYGSKIALQEFRSTPTNDVTQQVLSSASVQTNELNVFMEVRNDGDYELRYASPHMVSDGKWVAIEFKEHQLRVGDPFAGTDAYANIGTIFRVDLGDPNIYYKDHLNVATTIENALAGLTKSVDIKVVLPIHTKARVTPTPDANGDIPMPAWTNSANDLQCYKSGNACPENHEVCKAKYCNIDRWNEIIAALQAAGAQVLGLIDDGDHIDEYKTLTPVDGFYFGDGSLAAAQGTSESGVTVCAIGEPLFDKTAEDSCSTWVTLASDDLGVWTPYSWYPYTPSAKFAAMVSDVSEADITTTLTALFDRGYGYVFLSSEPAGQFFALDGAVAPDTLSLAESIHDHLEAVILGIGAVKGGRRLRGRGLQTQDDGVVTTKYECDDTLFECQPVCIQTKGVTRTKVSDAKCSGEKPTHCSCRCYYDAYWTVEKAAVVCKATMAGGDEKTVGDLVCIARGTPKPKWDPTEARTAGEGERKLDVQRMRRPTEQCLAEYAAESTEPAVEEVVETTQAPATTVAPVVGSLPELDLMGSAVSVVVGAALLTLA